MRNINFEVLIIAFVAVSFLWTFFKIIRVKMLGVEVDAVVTHLEEHETTDSDGMPSEYYEAYVRYQTHDGRHMRLTVLLWAFIIGGFPSLLEIIRCSS